MTDVVKLIGPTGDYATVDDWRSAAPTDLTASTTRWIGRMQKAGSPFSGPFHIFGHNPSPSYNFILEPAPGDGFADSPGLGFYDASAGVAFQGSNAGTVIWQVSAPYTIIRGLQFRVHGGISDGSAAFQINAYTEMWRNIFYVPNGLDITALAADSDTGYYFANLFLIGSNVTYGIRAWGQNAGSGKQSWLVGNTLMVLPGGSASVGINVGTHIAGGYPGLMNNAVFGAATAVAGDMAAHSGTGSNISSGSGFPGSGNVNGADPDDCFVDPATDLRPCSGSILFNAGFYISDVQLEYDILNVARDGTTPTVGAYEGEGGAVTPSTRTISLLLVNAPAGGDPQVSLTGLNWFVWTQLPPTASLGAPAFQGTTGSTDSSGVFTITLPGSTYTDGQVVLLGITDSDGTTSQYPPAQGYFGPAVVTLT